jgi:hypothetical protein
MIDLYDGTRIASGKSYKDYLKEAQRMEPQNYPHSTNKKKEKDVL